ncbi:hypothetical protein NliqN6_3960 [Naganishia liquefaciens]|uniref:Uncharacterized protein n=1 Tax=Naganishia liquefaciens TaxID=104408 RepID=A0A8H3TVA5_9TREE|nr:hypothetical protein NliqN6_3960 [Naganishia liquefaciens]
MIATLIHRLISTSTSVQILFALPLSLDWLGPPSFLLLSLLLITYHVTSATLRLVTRNTPLASLTGLLDIAQPLVPAACALVTCYLYLHPSDQAGPPAQAWHLPSMDSKRLLGTYLPAVYAHLLRFSSPVFSVLEGFATLLVAQCAGRFTKAYIEDGVADDKEEFEWRRLFALVFAAIVYCAGAGWLIAAHPLSPPHSTTHLPPILLGAALTTVFFLTMIGFTRRRATVVETALVFLYVIYCAWISGKEELLEPRSFGNGWLTTGWARPKSLPAELVTRTAPPAYLAHLTSTLHLPSQLGGIVGFFLTIFTKVTGLQSGWMGAKWMEGRGEVMGLEGLDMVGLATNILQHATDTMWKVAISLPPTMLISLCFRILALSLAARIIPMIRRASAGWDAEEEDRDGGDSWDDKTLGEEAPSARLTTILLSYRKAILIAVYTHLLLLDNGSQVWWRWINIFITLGVWALELNIEDEYDDDGESMKSWKMD